MPAIEPGYTANFDTLRRACKAGHLALLDCRDKTTGKPARVIVAVNRELPASLAEALAPVFTEVVVAPAFEPAALERLSAKKNLRLVQGPPPGAPALHVRSIDGGLLVQTPDRVGWDRGAYRVVTRRAPTEQEWADLELAWRVCAMCSCSMRVASDHTNPSSSRPIAAMTFGCGLPRDDSAAYRRCSRCCAFHASSFMCGGRSRCRSRSATLLPGRCR